MTAATAVAGIILLGLVLYGVFGGADFGTGVWDLQAGRGERGADLRRLIDHALGPVWEANHVWLIFVLVFTWTGFPDVFVAFVDATWVPLSIAAFGIVLRGAAFALRKLAPNLESAEALGVVFATSSVVTPFALGATAGVVASGRVPVDGGEVDRLTVWLTPTSLLGGTLAVSVCAFLAAVFLLRDAQRLGRDDLSAWLRPRALGAALVTGVVALGGVLVLRADATVLFDGLTGQALPVLVLSGLGGGVTIWAVWTRRYGRARVAAALAVATVVIGWGAGQYPALLVGGATIDEAAGAPAAMTGLLVAFAAAAVLVVPALVFLYVLVERGDLGAEGGNVAATGERRASS